MTTSRRDFLAVFPAAVIMGVHPPAEPVASEDTLHVLKGDDVERLRLDFNAGRDKVRLLFLLSPT